MVKFGAKKVVFGLPFLWRSNNQKTLQGFQNFGGLSFYVNRAYFPSSYLLETSSQLITLKNALM